MTGPVYSLYNSQSNMKEVTGLTIQSSGYLRYQSSSIEKRSSLDERFMWLGLGKYKKVLDSKNEYQRLIQREKGKKDGEGFCATV